MKILLHIQSLLLDLFYTHFPELIKRGYIYIAQPPKYAYIEGKKSRYINNDKDLVKFEYNMTKKKLSLNDYELKTIIENKHQYLEKFNLICSNRSISEKFLDEMILFDGENEDIDEKLKTMELTTDSDDNIVGIYDNIWHDINLNDLVDEVENLLNIINIDKKIEFDFNDGEIKDSLSPYKLLKFIDKKFHFEYKYFKGLGEMNASDLFDTTLDPNKRDILKISDINMEDSLKMLDDLFGSKTDARRELLKDYYSRV